MAETPSSDQETDIEASRAARIASARSDLVTSLGRRVSELRSSLHALEQDLGSGRLRDDLRRRVHALSAGARLLRFLGMATALAEVERSLERAASVGGLDASDVPAIASTFDSLSSLVWNEPTHEARTSERPAPRLPSAKPTRYRPRAGGWPGRPRRRRSSTQIRPHGRRGPRMRADRAFLLGPRPGARVGSRRGDHRRRSRRGKRADRAAGERSADRTNAPLAGGHLVFPRRGGRWMAMGARARDEPSPCRPKSCAKRVSNWGFAGERSPRTYRSVSDRRSLTRAWSEEVERGLPEALVQGKTATVALGDGSDVLAAVWGAVARIRDLVMIKTGGTVRFST